MKLQASTLPPSVDDPGVASWESGKLIPPMVGMGEEAAGKVKSRGGVGEGEQRESQRTT